MLVVYCGVGVCGGRNRDSAPPYWLSESWGWPEGEGLLWHHAAGQFISCLVMEERTPPTAFPSSPPLGSGERVPGVGEEEGLAPAWAQLQHI